MLCVCVCVCADFCLIWSNGIVIVESLAFYNNESLKFWAPNRLPFPSPFGVCVGGNQACYDNKWR